jgi:hypothetical protein
MKNLPVYYTFNVESEVIFNNPVAIICYSEAYATEQLRNSEGMFLSRDNLCNNDLDPSS